MSKLGFMTAACFALLVGAAQAQTAPAPAPAPSTPVKPATHERLICHEDNEIGSLVHKKKLCMTAAQWRQVTAENAGEFERHTAMKSGQSTR